MNQTELLFVYGTLRDGFNHDWANVLRKNAEHTGTAVFQGRLYATGSYPAVIPSDNEEDQVTGELYRVSNPAFVFAKLDSYEDYDSRHPEKSLFIRERLPVKPLEGETIKAWIYLYNRRVNNMTQISEGDYIAYLKRKK